MIKDNVLMADDKISDHNNINFIMTIRFSLRIIKLIIIIFNLSYFVGMGWLLFCEVVSRIDKNYYHASVKKVEMEYKEAC